MKTFELCYPNFSKKAISFTMDDGSVVYDKKLIDILSPYGIKGTFNLSLPDRISADEYRKLYRGYEIANHVAHHPYCFSDGITYNIVDEPFDENFADEDKIYPAMDIPGTYYIHRTLGWRRIAPPDVYIEMTKKAKRALEDVFGKDSVASFVWPFGEQNSALVKEYLFKKYKSVRKTGKPKADDNFDIPSDLFSWTCSATHENLLDAAEKFERVSNDGNLKLFTFGIHSADYEKFSRWDDVRKFAEMYGNRDNEFWYATIGEIFDYILATKKLTVSGDRLINESDIDIYIRLNGELMVIFGRTSISLS